MKTNQKLTTCFGLLATIAVAVAVVMFRRDYLTRRLLVSLINEFAETIAELCRG